MSRYLAPCDVTIAQVRHQLMGAAQDAYPDEACGIITFSGQVWTARNDVVENRTMKHMNRPEFVMNPADVLVMWPHAAAIWHSHPTGRLDASTVDTHWHPAVGATGAPLGMVIATPDDVRIEVPW